MSTDQEKATHALDVSALSSTATLGSNANPVVNAIEVQDHEKQDTHNASNRVNKSDITASATTPKVSATDAALVQGTDDAHLTVSSRSKGMLQLYVVWIPCFFLCMNNGYTHGGMTTVNTMTTYKETFNFTGLGIEASLVFAALAFGAIATFWLSPIVADNYGRVWAVRLDLLKKTGMCIILLGALLFAFAQNFPMLIAARVIYGFGMGTMFALIIGIGAEYLQSQWAWRIVIFVQAGLILACLISSLGMNETPCWCIAKGKHEQALAFLVKYHGSGEKTRYVEVEFEQMKAASEPLPKGIRDRWNFQTLLGKKGDAHRLCKTLFMMMVGQLCGNGLFYFMPQLAGQGLYLIKLKYSVIANIASIITAFIGSYVSDRAGRRRSLIFGSLALALAYAAAMVASSQTGVSSYVNREPAPNPSASIAGIAFLIVAQGVYGWAIATNVWTYPSEVLSTKQRTTAMSLAGLVTKLSLFVVNLFAVPIALEKIGWWTYLPFVLANPIFATIFYFFAVETKGVNLEELNHIFQNPESVKRSVERARLRRQEQKER